MIKIKLVVGLTYIFELTGFMCGKQTVYFVGLSSSLHNRAGNPPIALPIPLFLNCLSSGIPQEMAPPQCLPPLAARPLKIWKTSPISLQYHGSLSTACKLINSIEVVFLTEPRCWLLSDTQKCERLMLITTCCLCRLFLTCTLCVLCPCSSRRQHWCGINLPSRTPCYTPNVRPFFQTYSPTMSVLPTLFLFTLCISFLSESVVLHYMGKSNQTPDK